MADIYNEYNITRELFFSSSTVTPRHKNLSQGHWILSFWSWCTL